MKPVRIYNMIVIASKASVVFVQDWSMVRTEMIVCTSDVFLYAVLPFDQKMSRWACHIFPGEKSAAGIALP